MSRWLPGQSGNPQGRRAAAERLRALIAVHDEALVNKAIELAKAGDVPVLKTLLERLVPIPKQLADTVEVVGLAEASGLTAKSELILAAVGRGNISPDTATSLIAAIATVSKIAVDEVLDERIALLERIALRGVA